MASVKIEYLLSDLFEQWSGKPPELFLPLAPSGSNRIYYRLQNRQNSAIGAFGPDYKENKAFLTFSRHFKSKGLPVPEILAENLEENVYLQEDMGSTTLYSYLLQKGDYFPD